MIEFKKLELEDKARIQQYTMKSSRRNCDLTFANLYSWRFLYNTEIAEYGDCLLFRFDTDNMPAYMLPVGNGDLKEVIEGIMEDASMHGFPFRMFGVCADAVSQIEEVFPNRFSFEAERDYADYLYLHTDLATLKGKKYQPKRNHINKFTGKLCHKRNPCLFSEKVKKQYCQYSRCIVIYHGYGSKQIVHEKNKTNYKKQYPLLLFLFCFFNNLY